MQNSKNVWNELGKFLGPSEPNGGTWNDLFSEYLNDSDRNLPIVNTKFKKKISRHFIFRTLWEEVSFSILPRKSNPINELELINASYGILGITFILACLLSEKKEPGVGSKKRDSNVRNILGWMKKLKEIQSFYLSANLIKLRPEFEIVFSDIKNDVISLEQKFLQLVDQISKVSRRGEDFVTAATMGVDHLRRFTRLDDKQIKNIIECAIVDLKNLGFACTTPQGRLKNIMAQKLDEWMFEAGPLRRTKKKTGRKPKAEKTESKMEQRYHDIQEN